MASRTCSASRPVARWGPPPRIARAMSTAPIPRPPPAPVTATGSQSSPRRIRTSPVKSFGSGATIVASVPATSTTPVRFSGESKLNVAWATPVALEVVERRDVGRHADGDLLAGARPVADDPGGTRARTARGHAGDRAERLDERGQVVRAHVEQRSGTGLVEEVRVGVPAVRAGVLHHHGRGERRADRAGLDRPADGLQAGAEERVGRAAEQEAGGLGLRDERLGGRQPVGDRLLVPDVLAGRERGAGHLGVRGGDREVDDELHVVAREQRRDRAGAGDPVLAGPAPRRLHVEVGDAADVEVRVAEHVRQVLLADLPGADHADADRPAHPPARERA